MSECNHVFKFEMRNLLVDFICMSCGCIKPISKGQTLERIYKQPEVLDVVVNVVARVGIVNAPSMEQRIYNRIINYMEYRDTPRITRFTAQRLAYKTLTNTDYKTQQFDVFSTLEGDGDYSFEVADANSLDTYINEMTLSEMIRDVASNDFERKIADGLIAGYNATHIAYALKADKSSDLKTDTIRKAVKGFRDRCKHRLNI